MSAPHRHWWFASGSFAVCLMLNGCGGEANPLGTKAISGTVTLDGALLDEGSVTFSPQEAKGKTATAAVITKGKYNVPELQGLVPGSYHVTISAPEPLAQNQSADDLMNNPPPPRKERMPPRYNTQSDIVITVAKDGPNQFNFDAKSESP